jgi:hypothetical protein
MSSRRITEIGSWRIAPLGVALLLGAFAFAVTPATADPPPAGAGTTSHGFVFKRGALTAIDHPDAATIPRTPEVQAGTGTFGISDRGEILGVYEGRDRIVRNFVRDRAGRYRVIDDPPGTSGDGLSYETVSINNRRQIVGFYNDDQGATTSGFLRTRKGRFVDIDVPGSQVTGPLKINDRRQVVGIYVDAVAQPNADGSPPVGAVHGFLWDDGDYETIDVPGAVATLVLGINDRGKTVGSYIDAAGNYHGFVRSRKGAVRDLPEAPGADPAAGGTQPTSVNERGRIVGLGYESDGGSRGFLLRHGEFKPIDAPNATYTRAADVNNRGRVVGDYGTVPPGAGASTARPAARGYGLDLGIPGGRIRLP